MAIRQRYTLRFPDLAGLIPRAPIDRQEGAGEDYLTDVEIDLASTAHDAPHVLAEEVAHLVQFKTATLTEIGYRRNGIWNEQTARQKIDHLGLLFGALAASPNGPVAGRGVPLGKLTMALLICPAVWDWYVLWRERRRGFYTSWC